MTNQYQQTNINIAPDASQNSLFSGASAGIGGSFYGGIDVEVTRWDESSFAFVGAIEQGAITVDDSISNGTTFSINESGLWIIEFRWQFPIGATGSMGISTGGTTVISGTSPSVSNGNELLTAAVVSAMLNTDHLDVVGEDAPTSPGVVRFLCNSGVDPTSSAGGEVVFRKVGNFV